MKKITILKILSKISYHLFPLSIYLQMRHYTLRILERRKTLTFLDLLKKSIKYILRLSFQVAKFILLKLKDKFSMLKDASSALPISEVGYTKLPITTTEDAPNINSPISPSNIIKKPCSLVICCAFKERHHILSCAIQESFQSKYGAEIRWVLCGSTEEDNTFIQHMKRTTNAVDGFICENNPLGQKWQNCVSFAAENYDAQLYAIIGSDDIITAKLIDYVIDQDRQYETNEDIKNIRPALYATINWITFVNDLSNVVSPQIFECTILPSSYFQPIGAGRFYTRPFLNEVNFQVFDVKLERLLDDWGYYEIQKRNMPTQFYSIEEGALISVKGPWSQLNPIKDFFNSQTLTLNEYSFRYYDLIKSTCLPSTYDYLFRQNNVTQQLNFSSPSIGLQSLI